MNADRRLGALYICYLSLNDPLVHTQVVAYLAGLASEGHRIHLLTFETGRLTRRRRRELRDLLAEQGIAWHGLRYHKRPSLPATAYDTLAGAVVASGIVLGHRLGAVHGRNHVPVAMALIAKRLLWWRRLALIFDIRGLMAEEYEDAGRWTRDGVPFRLTKAIERRGIDRAEAIVVLTERVRQQLFGAAATPRVHVIPCCADLELIARARHRGPARRKALGLGEAQVMVYVGKFGGWYLTAEMARFFVCARASMPHLHFLILTQEDTGPITHELARAGADPGHYTITSAPAQLVAEYLAAADFGISLIRPAPSKASSSPTKIGEYLGAGLPVLCTAGVGDLDAMIGPEVGVIVHEHTDVAYAAAASRMASLLARPETGERCRALARSTLSLAAVGIPRYRDLYAEVAGTARPDRATSRSAGGTAPA
jgi:glycosyltransferase involved in cell wall biosynthesis